MAIEIIEETLLGVDVEIVKDESIGRVISTSIDSANSPIGTAGFINETHIDELSRAIYQDKSLSSINIRQRKPLRQLISNKTFSSENASGIEERGASNHPRYPETNPIRDDGANFIDENPESVFGPRPDFSVLDGEHEHVSYIGGLDIAVGSGIINTDAPFGTYVINFAHGIAAASDRHGNGIRFGNLFLPGKGGSEWSGDPYQSDRVGYGKSSAQASCEFAVATPKGMAHDAGFCTAPVDEPSKWTKSVSHEIGTDTDTTVSVVALWNSYGREPISGVPAPDGDIRGDIDIADNLDMLEELSPPYIEDVTFDIPDSICADETGIRDAIGGVVNISTNGFPDEFLGADITKPKFRIDLTNPFTGETKTRIVSDYSDSPLNKSEFSLEELALRLDIPEDVDISSMGENEPVLDVHLLSVGNNIVRTFAVNETIELINPEIELDLSWDLPDVLCSNNSTSASLIADVRNIAEDCGIDSGIDIEIEKPGWNREYTVDTEGETAIDFNITTERDVVSGGSSTIEARVVSDNVNLTDNSTTSLRHSIDVVNPLVDAQMSIETPELLCPNESGTGVIDINIEQMNSDCNRLPGIILKIIKDIGDNRDIDITEPGQHSFNISLSNRNGVSSDSVGVEARLEIQGGQFTDSSVTSISDSVNLGRPEIDILNKNIPFSAKPGEIVDISFDIENIGSCEADIRINSSIGQNTRRIIKPGESTTFNQEFEMGVEQENVNIEMVDGKRDEVITVVTSNIDLREAIDIDISRGTITTHEGLESEPELDGIMIAKGLNSDNESVESNSVLRTTFSRIDATLSSSVSINELANFSSAQYINLRLSSGSVVWIVDGVIEGESSSFEYSLYTLDAIESNIERIAVDSQSPMDESPETTISESRFRGLTRVLGVDNAILSGEDFG